jgi:glycogen debranching enzyme
MVVPDMVTRDARAERDGEIAAADGNARALEVMRACASEHGFLATPTERDNYRRVWARDGSIIGLAALLSEDEELIDATRRTLETLVRYQGPHGEIASNVDPATERVSYGGTTGRVDAGLWFAICCAEYWWQTRDDDFLEAIVAPLERLRALLGAWEFNTRGLLYVPPTGDWADEYVHSGYVLYDQLLYLQAQRGIAMLHRELHGSVDHALRERVARLRHLVRANYWFPHDLEPPEDVYHQVLYDKGHAAAGHRRGLYWMPFFSPLGYGTRFDGMANALVSLFGISDDEQDQAVDAFVEAEFSSRGVTLLPAFSPVITPRDEYWEELQMSFSYTFKNQPYEYHNGGLWPIVTAFYAAALARRGQRARAQRYRDAIHAANRCARGERDWSFSEYLHGRTHEPGGTYPMGWSAAAAVIADAYVTGSRLFGGEWG